MQAMIRTLFDYNLWAHERVWTGILTLDDEQFARQFDYSIGSVRAQIVHVLSVDNRWLARVAGRPTPDRLDPEAYPSAAAVREDWLRLTAEQRLIVEGLSDEQMGEAISYDMPQRGGMKHNLRREILAHVVNHGTDHRAQVLSLLHQMGAPTVEQDLILYLWERPLS
ncbi:MAG: DinB family protein [Anaerolineae bacterium]|nr:DinB family protein [Anaerolineae bacterium]